MNIFCLRARVDAAVSGSRGRPVAAYWLCAAVEFARRFLVFAFLVRGRVAQCAPWGSGVKFATRPPRISFKTELVVAIAGWVILATHAFAQSAIAGTVKDTTGAALPGVIVEVASQALIEKGKTTTTDGVGQYRLVELR